MWEYIKHLTKHSFTYGSGQILTKAIGFFLIPVYTRFLLPRDYGIVSIAEVIISILGLLYIMGQIGSQARFYFDYNDKPQELKEYIGTIVIFVFVVPLVITLGLTFFGKGFFGLIIKEIPFNPFILLAVWIAFLGIFFEFPLRLFQIREKSLKFALYSVVQSLLGICLVIYFVVIKREGALGYLKGNFWKTFVFFGLAWILLRHDIKLKINFKKLKKSLFFGLPLVPHTLAGWILTMCDRIFLNHFRTLACVGIYSIGYKFGLIMSIITTSINYAWMPFFFSTAKEKGEEAKNIFSRLTTYYLVAILFIGLIISTFSKEVIILMTTPKYYDAYKIVPIITFTYVLNGMYFMVANAIFFMKKTRFLPIATFSAAILNIGFNLLLIPKYGMLGAAGATMLSFVFLFLFTWFLSYKVYPIKYEYGRILRLFGICFIVYFVAIQIKTDVIWKTVLSKMGILSLYFIGLYVIGFFSEVERAKIKEYKDSILKKVRLLK